MQCRYCFGDEDVETMITPCLCRGTSQYTHQSCLQRYFTYYPDRMCRICNTRMEYVSTFERVLPCVFVPVLTSLVMVSSMSPPSKFMMVLGGLGLSALFATQSIFHKDIATGSFFLGVVLLSTRHDLQITMWVLGAFGILAWFRTVLQYIQPEILLLFLTCTLVVVYLVLFTMSIVTHLDSLGSAIFVVQMFLYWQSLLHLRPGHTRNRIHNE
jgi:hypothetical protein